MSRARYFHLALAAVLLALLLWKTDVTGVATAVADVSPVTAALVVLLNVPIALLFGLRSHLVLRKLGHDIPARVLLPVAILGNVAGSLTPASTGELLRTAILKSHADVTGDDSFALVLYERGLSVYLMALGTGVAAAFIALPLLPAAAIACAAAPLFALPLAGSVLLRRLPKREPGVGPRIVRRPLGRVSSVAGRFAWLLRERRLLASWSAVTAAIFCLVTLQFWLLARALSGAVSPQEAWIAFGASQLAAIVSLLPLGLGAADGSIAALLRRAGMTLEQGTAVAILVRATITLPLGLAAVLCYLYLQRTRGTGQSRVSDASVPRAA